MSSVEVEWWDGQTQVYARQDVVNFKDGVLSMSRYTGRGLLKATHSVPLVGVRRFTVDHGNDEEPRP
jgi:hypothetical protein